MKEAGINVDYVLEFDVPDRASLIVDRIVGRRARCFGRVYYALNSTHLRLKVKTT